MKPIMLQKITYKPKMQKLGQHFEMLHELGSISDTAYIGVTFSKFCTNYSGT